MKSFRDLVVAGVAMRLLDICGHVVLGVVLPGPVWLQFIPDSFLLVLFPLSWRRDRLLPENNPIVFSHKLFHTVTFPAIMFLVALALNSDTLVVLSIQWLGHVGLDGVTHSGTLFEKNLFWPGML